MTVERRKDVPSSWYTAATGCFTTPRQGRFIREPERKVNDKRRDERENGKQEWGREGKNMAVVNVEEKKGGGEEWKN